MTYTTLCSSIPSLNTIYRAPPHSLQQMSNQTETSALQPTSVAGGGMRSIVSKLTLDAYSIRFIWN